MTQFNARFARVDCEVVSPKSGERWLLVTSAHHMPRSVGIFRKVGFEVEPYPVNRRTGGRDDLLKFSDHFVERLSLVDTAAREWLGSRSLLDHWQEQRVRYRSKRALIPSPAAGRPIKPLIEGLRDLQRSFDFVDATQVLIDP